MTGPGSGGGAGPGFDFVPLAAAERLFDDWSQTATAHDMAPLIEAGLFGQDRLHAELAAVVAGEVPGRQRDDEVIVVRTEGMASQDIALAHWTWQAARAAGMATRIGL